MPVALLSNQASEVIRAAESRIHILFIQPSHTQKDTGSYHTQSAGHSQLNDKLVGADLEHFGGGRAVVAVRWATVTREREVESLDGYGYSKRGWL